jgi:hypothetical protein
VDHSKGDQQPAGKREGFDRVAFKEKWDNFMAVIRQDPGQTLDADLFSTSVLIKIVAKQDFQWSVFLKRTKNLVGGMTTLISFAVRDFSTKSPESSW